MIDDAAYRELRYDGPDLPSVRSFDASGETVIYTHTFSKSFSPGMRVGWGILPSSLVEPICEQKGNLDFGSPHFNQHVMATVLDERLFEPQLERLVGVSNQTTPCCRRSTNTCHRFGRAAGSVLAAACTSGLNCSADVPAGPDGPLFDLALEAGVIYVPGEY